MSMLCLQWKMQGIPMDTATLQAYPTKWTTIRLVNSALLILLLLIGFGSATISALSVEEITGTWYRELDPPAAKFPIVITGWKSGLFHVRAMLCKPVGHKSIPRLKCALSCTWVTLLLKVGAS